MDLHAGRNTPWRNLLMLFFFFFELFHTEGSLQGPVSVHTLFWTWSWFAPVLLRTKVWLKLSWGAAWRLHWCLSVLSPRKMCVCCEDLGHAAGLVCVSPGRGYGQVALGRGSSFCTKRCGMHRDRLCEPEEKGSAPRCSEMWENGSYGKAQPFCMACMFLCITWGENGSAVPFKATLCLLTSATLFLLQDCLRTGLLVSMGTSVAGDRLQRPGQMCWGTPLLGLLGAAWSQGKVSGVRASQPR